MMQKEYNQKAPDKNQNEQSEINGSNLPKIEVPFQYINNENINSNKDEKQNILHTTEEEKEIVGDNNLIQIGNEKKESNFDFEVKAENFNLENNNENNNENNLDDSNDNEEQEQDLIDEEDD